MALPNSTYLMRHGRYDGATGDLIVPAGYHDADNGARELQQAGLGSAALILSSTVKRARQTAQRVGGALECTVLYSDELARWGNSPEGLTDFEEMIEAELAAQSPPVRPGDIAGGFGCRYPRANGGRRPRLWARPYGRIRPFRPRRPLHRPVGRPGDAF